MSATAPMAPPQHAATRDALSELLLTIVNLDPAATWPQ